MEQYERNWKNYYEILQVSPNAEAEVITSAYRRLAQKYHPDATKDASSARMAELNLAYGVLADPVKRSEYDREFNKRQTGNTTRTNTQSATTKNTTYRNVRSESDNPYTGASPRKATLKQKGKEGGTAIRWGLFMLIGGFMVITNGSIGEDLRMAGTFPLLVGFMTLALGLLKWFRG